MPPTQLVWFLILFIFLILRGKSADSCFEKEACIRSQPLLTAALSIEVLEVKL